MANSVTLTVGRESGSANGSRIRGRNTCLAGNPCYTTAPTHILHQLTKVSSVMFQIGDELTANVSHFKMTMSNKVRGQPIA